VEAVYRQRVVHDGGQYTAIASGWLPPFQPAA
jgi:hypothetical protein